jgi:hypothetical protein
MNRPVVQGGLQAPKDGSHGGAEQVPGALRERAIRFAVDLVKDPEKLSVSRLQTGR